MEPGMCNLWRSVVRSRAEMSDLVRFRVRMRVIVGIRTTARVRVRVRVRTIF